MSELQELVQRLHRWRRAAVLLPLAGLLVIAGLGWYARVQRERAASAHLQATEAGKREAIWRQQAEDSDRAATFSDEKVRQKEAEVYELQAKLAAIPRPAPPVPAPADDAQLAEGLAIAGLTPGLRVLVLPPGPDGKVPGSTLGHLDATLVWRWNQDALRLPPTEARLEVSLDLNRGQVLLVEAQKVQVLDLTTSRNAWKGAAGACDERADALSRETRALQRSLRTERWQKWLMVGGAAAVGFYAGRK